MVHKMKDKKYFQQYLRKIFCKDAYIFFTLDKLITGATKLLTSLTSNDLTYKILKEQTKDYELGMLDW